jgi:hypothetical protein
MTELNMMEDQLTTADIAARTSGPAIEDVKREEVVSPKLARNEVAGRDWDNTPQRAQDTVAGTPLFSNTDIGDLRTRWGNVQAGFVDEPRRSVEAADQLVATVMQRLAEGFANERASLEKQWDSGETASTEDLRIALQRYRAFFDRLLNAA